MVMTHGQGPNAGNVPADQTNSILHARLELGNTVVMGGMLRDRFGTSWMLLHEVAAVPRASP